MASRTARWQCVLTIWLAVAVIGASRVSAQNAGLSPAATQYVNLRSGDCRIVVQLPAAVSLGTARLLRNGNETTAQGKRRGKVTTGTQQVTFTVLEPPQYGDQFTVTAPQLTPSLTATVTMQGFDRTRCNIKDDRDAFAPTVLFGVAADAFAPNEERFYPINDGSVEDAYKLRNSMIVRLDAALRLGGNNGGLLDRFWVEASMKYAVRSTDLECQAEDGSPGKDSDAPNCRSALALPMDPGGLLTAAVLRASKIE